MLGRVAPRQGVRRFLEDGTPCNVYQCKPHTWDAYCYIHCADDAQWRSLLRVMRREDLAEDPRFQTAEARTQHSAEVDRFIEEWTRGFTKDEVMKLLVEAGVPAAAVLTCDEARSNPHLQKRGTFVTIQHPRRGPMVVPGWPVKMSNSPVEVVSPPLLGQDSDAVLREWLGMGDQEIARLREENVI